MLLNDRGRMNFWKHIDDKLINEGFKYWFEVKTKQRNGYFAGSSITPDSYAIDFTNNISSILKKIPSYLSASTIKLGSDFKALSELFEILYNFLNIFHSIGNWEEVFKSPENKNLFSQLFGIYPENADNLLTTESFRDKINEIFYMFYGEEIITIFPDGSLWFSDATPELEAQKIALSSLVAAKMTKVIEGFDKIRKFEIEGNYNDALGQCRDTAEDFLKDFLIKHQILTVLERGNQIPTQNASLSSLCQALRTNYTTLFSLPSYFNPRTNVGYDKYFLVIDNLIGGITNEFSHGRGTIHSIQATKQDVKVTFGFIITMITTLLAYQM